MCFATPSKFVRSGQKTGCEEPPGTLRYALACRRETFWYSPVMQHIYAQGQFLPADTPFITASDRSFRFGDGIFETILVVDGKLYDAGSHFARLKNGLEPSGSS
jgi:hypothetical protein